MLDPATDYDFQEAVEIVFPDDAMGNEVAYRRWTGAGPFTHGGNRYESGGILSTGEIQVGRGLTESTSIVLDVTTSADRDLFLGSDPGPAETRIFEMWRKRPHGGAWTPWTVDQAYRGKLSTPEYEDGQITIEVQRVFDDIWRGRPLRWTGTDQQRRFPGDTGLDRADRIRRSGLLVATT